MVTEHRPDHRQIVKRFYRLYAIKDIRATMDLFDPQGAMHPAENFIYATGKPCIGPEEIRNYIFTRVDDDWDGFTATADEILGAEEVVIARGRYRGMFKATYSDSRTARSSIGRATLIRPNSRKRWAVGARGRRNDQTQQRLFRLRRWILGRFPRYVVVAMAPAALVSTVDGQHGTIVHAAAPQISETVQKARGARAFGGIGNNKLRHLLQQPKTRADTILAPGVVF
jgi:hypothetical protein